MIAVVMAGGKGSRMKSNDEKLLLHYKKPLIHHVIDALEASKCFEKIVAITSQNSPKTHDFLKELGIDLIETSGNSYVEDLNQILVSFDEPIFVISGDFPFIDGDIIKQIVTNYNPENVWQSFVVTKQFIESLELTAEFEVNVDDEPCYLTGISLINSKKIPSLSSINESYEILNDKRIAFNLNTKHDYELLSGS